MASSYPGGLDSLGTSHQDNVNEVIHAATVNDLADAVNKIESTLGTNPQGGSANVKGRIAATETVANGAQIAASAAQTTANAAIPESVVTTKGDMLVATGSGVVARLGVGSNTQVLTADSTQSGGVKWAAAASPASPLTTKGDIWGYSTVDARIPVGANNQVLTADSTQSLGVKWATPTAASVPAPVSAGALVYAANNFV